MALCQFIAFCTQLRDDALAINERFRATERDKRDAGRVLRHMRLSGQKSDRLRVYLIAAKRTITAARADQGTPMHHRRADPFWTEVSRRDQEHSPMDCPR